MNTTNELFKVNCNEDSLYYACLDESKLLLNMIVEKRKLYEELVLHFLQN